MIGCVAMREDYSRAGRGVVRGGGTVGSDKGGGMIMRSVDRRLKRTLSLCWLGFSRGPMLVVGMRGRGQRRW